MFNQSFAISIINLVLAVFVCWLLLWKLDSIYKNKKFASENVEQKVIVDTQDTTKTTTQTVISTLPAVDAKGEKPFVNFIDIIWLMLISGGLGGILCNLRGIFTNYRREGALPDRLFVPYLTRPFTAAICGVFVYFVASMLVTSITLTPIAYGVGFQGMISYMAFAIVAGFGSQEFMERLKALALTLFGERPDRTPAENLMDWQQLVQRGYITQEDYIALKNKALGLGGETAGEIPAAPDFERKSKAKPE
jgi:hypothetical protein